MGVQQSTTLNSDTAGRVTTGEFADDGTGTSRWYHWLRLPIGAQGALKAEDAAHVDGDAGIMALAVRRDTRAASSGTTGDYEPLQTNALGELRVVNGNIPGYPSGATALTASSGNVANAAAVATLAAAASVTTYITGFQITAAGATVGLPVIVTVVGLISGTNSHIFIAPAGVLVAATPLIVTFRAPVPASAVNTAIVVTLPALGAGNTHAAVSAQGFRI